MWSALNAVSNLLLGSLLGPAQLLPGWLAGVLLGALSAPVAMRVLRYGVRLDLPYLARAALPVLVLAGPFTLALVQLEARFALRPLAPSEQAVLRVELDEGLRASELDARIRVPRGLTLETPALRKDRSQQIAWRLRADAPGRYLVKVWVGEQVYERRLLVGGRRFALARRVCASSDVATLLAPSERALADSGPVRCIEIDYPARGAALGLSDAAWGFIGGALLLGFALRRSLGVAR